MSGSAAVTVRRTSYPQVDPRAAGLMTPALVVAPPGLGIEEAARLMPRRRSRLVVARVAGGWAGATRETLGRALELGLGAAPLDTVLWDAVLVAPGTPEVLVRRRLGPGRPFVLVGGARGPVGVVFREPAAPAGLPLSVAARLSRLAPRVRDVLRTSGALADALGLRIALVGGLVRDLLLDRAPARADLDLVVEGSAATLATRLAARLSGETIEHAAFLTATVVLPGGLRIDLAGARRETYRAPGALPRVEAATFAEDLGRRDFSINALAIRLDSGVWGRLIDTTGGLADLRARQIRILHPLSFLEDPTRLLRAARFAARLGCRVDPATRRLGAGAARLDVFDALSGDRVRAEIELLLSEPRPVAALREARRLGAWRLLGPDADPGPRAERLLARALGSRVLREAGREARLALCLLALAEGGPAVDAWSGRLALPPALREAIRRARTDAPGLLARLGRIRGRAAAYAILQGMPEVTLAWARTVSGNTTARRYVDDHLRRWRRLPTLATGDDVLALGVPPGPAVGALLRRLREAQVDGQVRGRAGALRWLAGVVARGRGRREVTLTRPGRGGG
jgi:tRNA nucleotidyltransferase (CCA-adding enzyme)